MQLIIRTSMPSIGKPDKTGRSSGTLVRKERALIAPPPGEAWAWITLSLLASDAWSGMSGHCHKFVSFLMADHCYSGGIENGNLQATYDQLSRIIPRKRISGAIREAVERGLVRITRQGGMYGLESRRTTSLYRLTWIGTLRPAGSPTNEWRKYRKQGSRRGPRRGNC